MIKEVTLAGIVGASAPFLVGALGVAPPPEGMWWVPYAVTFAGGIGAALIQLFGHLYTGRRRARAEFDEEESARMLADGDPSNDDKARALRLEAKEIRADADAIDKTVTTASDIAARVITANAHYAPPKE